MPEARRGHPFEGASGAVFSPCRSYRYALWRTWDETRPRIFFVGLNPSRADERSDDPTLRRCVGFARSWEFGGLLVGNLFAWRTPDPARLRRAPQPVGPDNDSWLAAMARAAERIVVCWGRHGSLLGRDLRFADAHDALWCIGVNLDGAPTHPLYLPANRRPAPWPVPARRQASRGSSARRITVASSLPPWDG